MATPPKADADKAVTIFHNPNCGTSRNVLAAIRARGIEPVVVEYIKTGWTKPQLKGLLKAMDAKPRDILRVRGTPAELVEWRMAHEDSRANLVIEDMTPTGDEDAMFAMMLDEGVPPSLMPSIILGLYKPGTDQIAA